MSVEYSSVDEVAQFPNSTERQMSSLSANTPWGKSPSVSMKFKNSTYYPVEYEVRGPERDVFHISSGLEEFISTIRQWYSRIALLDYVMVIFGAISATWAFGVMYVAFYLIRGGHRQTTSPPSRGNSDISIFVYAIFISAVVLGGLLNVLRGWLYPVATFALGHGAERYRSVVFWRRLVGVSFGVSLLASVTAAYITR